MVSDALGDLMNLIWPVHENNYAGFGGEAGGGAQPEGAREVIDGIACRIGVWASR
jgi:hypothetical protein